MSNNGIFGHSYSVGKNIFTNNWLNTPAANSVGDLWICPDARYYDYFIWDGNKWQAYIQGRRVNIPTRDFKWKNYSGTVNLNFPYITTGKFYHDSAYSGPSYGEAAFVHTFSRVQYEDVSIGCMNISDYKTVYVSVTNYNNIGVGIPQIYCSKFNNPNSWNSTYSIERCASYFIGCPLIWLRMYDDGSSTRYAQFSSNGINWQTFYSGSRTDFTTGNRFVIALNGGILVHYNKTPVNY